jgi:hypothetical protein
MTTILSCTRDSVRLSIRWGSARSRLGLAAMLLCLAGCKETTIPYFAAPTSVPANSVGIQQAITGLFGQTRSDQVWYLMYTSAWARNGLVFFSSDGVYFINELAGLTQSNAADVSGYNVWDNEFATAKQANAIIATLPAAGTYTTAQIAAITGVMQTMKALNFIYVAETRDTLGIPVYAIENGTSSPPYCNQDVWKYIVALLDSGNAALNTAGAIALPISVPPGFASVGSTAAPSGTAGSFAAFNRALAAKAGLELAYAIARGSPATHPTPTTPGSPDITALTRADSAMLASALYNTGAIAPPAAGSFALDPFGVYHTFSAQSGDETSPLNQWYPELAPLYDMTNDVDTVNDLRWLNKFAPNPVPLQLPSYNPIADPMEFVPYASVNSPEPIVRAEELALVRAQIRLGLGDFAGAINLINIVHQQAGGFTSPLTIAATYTAVRDSLLKEQRISTVFEGGGDRAISIRMYGLAAVADTTWQATSGPDATAIALLTAGGTAPVDLHTTVSPIPSATLLGRGGNYALSCP